MTKGNKRLHHESQKAYKRRLRFEQKYIKGYLRGRRIWNPLERGTLVGSIERNIKFKQKRG